MSIQEHLATVTQSATGHKPETIASIRAKFASMSLSRLISRMERSPDFGYDDEEVELAERLLRKGQEWCWSRDVFHPRVLVTPLAEALTSATFGIVSVEGDDIALLRYAPPAVAVPEVLRVERYGCAQFLLSVARAQGLALVVDGSLIKRLRALRIADKPIPAELYVDVADAVTKLVRADVTFGSPAAAGVASVA